MGGVSAGVKGVAGAAGMIGMFVAFAGRERADAATVPIAATGTLCTPAETPLFTCAVGSRRVAVCGTGSGATYRYGRPGKVELASGKVTLARRAFSGGGETQITATNGDHRYTVFARTLRTSFDGDGRADPQSLSGLLVRRGGRTLSVKACGDDAPILARAAAVIPAGVFVPH